MRSLAQRLIAEERRAGAQEDSGSVAAFRVCEKMRRPLATFAGTGGYRSLLKRALVLARAEAPWLDGLQIKSDGTFEFSSEAATQLDTTAAVRASTLLTEQLLELLGIFIGEALTLRLVQEVWPEAALPESNSEGKSL